MDLRKLGRGFLEASEERWPKRHRAGFETGPLPRHIGQGGCPRPARQSSQSKPSSPPAIPPAVHHPPAIQAPGTEPTMQPSEYEIQQEVEALRDIRRRSTAGGPGSLLLDPDLPNAAAGGANGAYWPPTDDSSSSSHEDGSDSSHVSAQDDPFHLFWVPASLHPEIAPAEFRQFLKEHARANPDDAGTGQLGRAPSLSSSSSLSRKKSMLSRQYQPSANDGVEEEEKVMPLRRNRTSVYGYAGPQLTINDLQKLEELAEEASQSDDPSKLRKVLRRSLSLNIAPSVIDQMDMPDTGDDADAPIIVPRPGSILRRTARTKIRKPGQTGEGAHRFTATRSRRKSIGRAATMDEPRSSSDLSSSDHGDGEIYGKRPVLDIPEIPPLPRQARPESYSEESSIYDAYVTDEPGEIEPPPGLSPISEPESEPERASTAPPVVVHPEPGPVPEPVLVAPPVLHQPQPQRPVPPSSVVQPSPERTASPDSQGTPRSSTSTPPRPSLQSTQPYVPPSTPPSERKEKDKKGLFGWKSDKGTKKGGKEAQKESGFFGSLFGGKKKHEETPPSMTRENGREAAVALLGASKSSKNYVPPPSPQLAGQYARYPIHVERAIYRLSHIKLANPRRPLYEQVLISNLMFWYLGVINKQQSTPSSPVNGNGTQAAAPQPEVDEAQRAEKEREERERAEKERQEQLERDRAEQQRKEASRRGTLTKAAPPGSPGGRRAEAPVRGPQYDVQHRAMEQEYGYGGPASSGPPMNRAPPQANGAMSGHPVPSQSRASSSSPAPYGSQPQANNRYYPEGPQPYPTMASPTPQLPPGAMPPAAVEQAWQSVTQAPPRHSPPSTPARSASPPTARRARSPPPSNNRYTPAQEKQPYSGQRMPSRSVSASAAPPMPVMPNGKLRKNTSAHAVVPRQASEDEDMPLAMWQQQQRRK